MTGYTSLQLSTKPNKDSVFIIPRLALLCLKRDSKIKKEIKEEKKKERKKKKNPGQRQSFGIDWCVTL